jgi:hypothetical protein
MASFIAKFTATAIVTTEVAVGAAEVAAATSVAV